MAVLMVLLAAWLLFGGLGALGVEQLSTWQGSAAWALAVMFLFTASAHFTKTKDDLVKMVPTNFPNPRLLVALTGILEVLGAVGLLLPATRGLAGIGLALMMVAMFPANVSAARSGVKLRGRPPTPLWIRVPMQIFFIGLAVWVSGVWAS